MSDPLELEVVSESAVEPTARIDVRVSTARAFPRNIGQVKEELKAMALTNEETAESCFYVLPPRGKKKIEGPGIRLAEMAANAWGNLVIATRIKSVDAHGAEPHVIVEGVASDLQKNVHVSVEKRRRILTKKDFETGGRKPVDDDDINLAVNSCSAIAYRDAVFKAVPRAIINPVYEMARKVAVGELKSLGDKRNRVIEKLKLMGAKEKSIYAAVGVTSIEEVTAEKLEELIGIGTSLKEGSITLEDAFPEPVGAPEIKTAPETPPAPKKRAKRAPSAADEPSSEPAPEPEPPDDVPMSHPTDKKQAPPAPEPTSQAEPEAPAQEPEPGNTPQAELETILSEAGYVFDDLAILISGNPNYARAFPKNASWMKFADISDGDCKRIISAKTALLNAMAKLKAGQP